MKIGFTASAFDLGPHAGHLAMLKEARANCDYLIVGLHVNPATERDTKNKPIQSVSERYFQLKGCRYVDEVIPYETEEELLNLLLLVQPEVRFLGSDYMFKEFTGKEIAGIEIHFCKRSHNISSSALRNRIIESKAIS
jgi:glycerol-3-phosphate cytidylyltransferase